jgi:hypothetical protein
VALRDGLYSACQAYANGIIGKAAYALIISQYGDLLTNLAGSGAGGGSSGPAVGTPAGGTPAASTPAASTPSAGNSQVQVLQQQMLQAMMVSCITNSDPTQDHPNNVRAADSTLSGAFNADGSPNEQTYKTTNLVPAADQNQLLNEKCSGFFDALGKALPTIIAEGAESGANGGKPVGQTGGKAPAAGAKVPASPQVTALQKTLVADGDLKGSADGVIGPQTEAALTLYVAKHPAVLPAPH